MRNSISNKLLLAAVRLIVGGAFLWSSIAKISRPYEFLSTIYHYQLSGPRLSLLVAMGIPWMELTAAICLIGRIFLDGALVVTALLGILFSIAVGSAIQRGLHISCGCFTAADDMQISYWTLLRSISLVIAGIVGLVAQQSISRSPLPIQARPAAI